MSHEKKEAYEYTTNFHRKAAKSKALNKAKGKKEYHHKGDDKLISYKESK